jgi:hypothetical protein
VKDKRKQPVAGFTPQPAKQARAAAMPDPRRQPVSHAPSLNSERPSWRVSKIETSDPFGWHVIDEEKLTDIRAKLAQFESMTWNEILVASKKQNHSVFVGNLCKEAQERLQAIGLGDVESLISLRLSGRERVWGWRQGTALLLLWWDPEHRVCPSLSKHT